MHPVFYIHNISVSSWDFFLLLGIIATTALLVCSKPPNFIIGRPSIFFVGLMLAVSGITGGRLLYILLHRGLDHFTLSRIIFLLRHGGYAYFGTLLGYIAAISIYTGITKKNFLVLADYFSPFLMLSQAFVRVGCLMAGCCYGRPASLCFGVTFNSVDDILRHPTQIYEAILLLSIYIITRSFYIKYRAIAGRTFFLSLILYGTGRFFIEFFRVDSPPVFMGITFAQVTCLVLTLIAAMGIKRVSGSPAKSNRRF